MKLNLYLLGSTLVAALAGFLFGFDTVVISGTTKMLETSFSLSPAELGFTVASALIGTVVGSLIAGKPAEWLGRKPVLMWLAVLYFVSAVGCGFAWDWYSLLIFRLVGGLAIGGASVVAPLYIAEISPPHARGRLVAVSQLNIVAGLLVAYVSNFVIVWVTAGDPACWRWMLGIVAVPAVFFFLLLLPIPESPRWLVKQHRRDEALTVLQRLGNEDAGGVLREIVDSLHEETVGVDEPFFRPKYSRPILLAFMVASFNQLAGINAVLYYSGQIFEMAGAGQTSALGQSIIIGLTNLVFTLLGMSMIDHFGRRKLLIIGAAGLAICQGAAAYAFHMADQMASGALSASNQSLVGILVLGSLIGFIAFFAFSSGAVIWVFISEIFPNRVRARGQALGSFTHWAWCALINFSFPVIVAHVSRSAPFAFFSAMMVLQLVLVWRFLPETKGVSLEEMQRHLGIE
ncbi:MAG: sugar porter family MFS transporter [Thermoguttaceae bacterium]